MCIMLVTQRILHSRETAGGQEHVQNLENYQSQSREMNCTFDKNNTNALNKQSIKSIFMYQHTSEIISICTLFI